MQLHDMESHVNDVRRRSKPNQERMLGCAVRAEHVVLKLLNSSRSASKQKGLTDHPRWCLAGNNTSTPGLCLIS
jgi:hypothetical protein